jgi:hypothetical protein
MDTAVLAALIAAFASLLAVAGKTIWDAMEKRRKHQRAEQVEQRRYRSLLLGAANDLRNRLDNIRTHDFFYCLEADDRRDIALRATLITATFASDLIGRELMLWREEQSAIADSMRTTGPIPGCIGFSFFARHQRQHSAGIA